MAEIRKFEPYRGIVWMSRRGAFKMENEVLRDHGQMPQFFPRREWPNHDNPPELPNRYDMAPDNQGVPLDWDAVQLDYHDLDPMPPYQNNANYQDIPWWHQVGHSHNALAALLHGEMVRQEQIRSLLAIVSYGMGLSVCCEYPFWIDGNQRGNAPYAEQFVAEFDMNMKTAGLGFDLENQDGRGGLAGARARIAGKRWIVVPIQTRNPHTHWSMTIFDRRKGQLYIFDATTSMRDQRILAITHIWARYLNHLGFPHHFQYIVPETTPCREPHETGWHGVIWVMHNLRDQVGTRMTANNPEINVRNISLGDPDPGQYASTNSSLYLCDWVPRGCVNVDEGRLAALYILTAVLLNELGLWYHGAMHITWMAGHDPDDERTRSVMTRLNWWDGELHWWEGAIDGEDFWTGFGGPQFAIPSSVVSVPQDWRVPRRIVPRRPLARHPVRYDLPYLNPPPQNLNWAPVNPLTAAIPMRRRPTLPELRVQEVVPFLRPNPQNNPNIRTFVPRITAGRPQGPVVHPAPQMRLMVRLRGIGPLAQPRPGVAAGVNAVELDIHAEFPGLANHPVFQPLPFAFPLPGGDQPGPAGQEPVLDPAPAPAPDADDDNLQQPVPNVASPAPDDGANNVNVPAQQPQQQPQDNQNQPAQPDDQAEPQPRRSTRARRPPQRFGQDVPEPSGTGRKRPRGDGDEGNRKGRPAKRAR